MAATINSNCTVRNGVQSNKRNLGIDSCEYVSGMKRHQSLIDTTDNQLNNAAVITYDTQGGYRPIRHESSIDRDNSIIQRPTILGPRNDECNHSQLLHFNEEHHLNCFPLSQTTLLIKNIQNSVVDTDIQSLLSPFVPNNHLPCMTFHSDETVSVIMPDSHSATLAAQYLSTHTPQVKGVPITASILSSAPQESGHSTIGINESIIGGRVLLVTVTDIRFSVDIHLLHGLFSSYGFIEKIVTFSKPPSRFQSLIQFSNQSEAHDALLGLHSKCIFDGCNTLQIQLSKLSELVVKTNNSRSWDFLVSPLLPAKNRHYSNSLSRDIRHDVCINPVIPNYHVPSNGSWNNNPTTHSMNSSIAQDSNYLLPPPPPIRSNSSQLLDHIGQHNSINIVPPLLYSSQSGQASPQSIGSSYGTTCQQMSRLLTPAIFEKLPRDLQNYGLLRQMNPNNTSVVICHNLPAADINVTKLFNLFSLYGVVERIKLLRDKQDTALIQFSDPLFATLACHYLHGAPLFGTDAGMQIGISKNTQVKLPLMSGSGASKETLEEAKRTLAFLPKDQRCNPDEVEKFIRGSCKPTSTLFIANIHDSVRGDVLQELLSTIGTVTTLELRPPKERGKKSTAMVQMMSEKEALSAICHLHNYRLADCNIKLAFSKQILGGNKTSG